VTRLQKYCASHSDKYIRDANVTEAVETVTSNKWLLKLNLHKDVLQLSYWRMSADRTQDCYTDDLNLQTWLENASFQCGVQPIDTFCFLHCYSYYYHHYYYHQHHHQHHCHHRHHLFVMCHRSTSMWHNRNALIVLYCIVLLYCFSVHFMQFSAWQLGSSSWQ